MTKQIEGTVDDDVVRVVGDAWDVALADAVFDLVHASADEWATHTSLVGGTVRPMRMVNELRTYERPGRKTGIVLPDHLS